MKYTSFVDIANALSIIAKRTAYIKKREAELNEKITQLKQKFDIDTAEAQTEIEVLRSDIEKFCIDNKYEFENNRTKEFVNGKIGFRVNPPKVLQLNKKFSVSNSIDLIKTVFKGIYLRIKEEIDKDKILADYREQNLTDQQLAKVGLRIDQGETFFIEPSWEKFIEEKSTSKIK